MRVYFNKDTLPTVKNEDGKLFRVKIIDIWDDNDCAHVVVEEINDAINDDELLDYETLTFYFLRESLTEALIAQDYTIIE